MQHEPSDQWSQHLDKSIEELLRSDDTEVPVPGRENIAKEDIASHLEQTVNTYNTEYMQGLKRGFRLILHMLPEMMDDPED